MSRGGVGVLVELEEEEVSATAFQATLRFVCVLGAAVRSNVISQLRSACFLSGLEFDAEEDRGWFESHYRISISGDEAKVRVMQKVVEGLEL